MQIKQKNMALSTRSSSRKLCNDGPPDGFGLYSDVYAKLAANRVIFLKNDLTAEIGSTISALLIYYDSISQTEDINFYINTNGGDSYALINIYDVINMIKAPVNTICIGKAYSAGAFLLASGKNRMMHKNAKVMIHGIQFAFPPPSESNQIDAENYYKYIEDHNTVMLSILSKHTKQPLSKVKEDCSRDLFLTSEQALKYGLIDSII